MVSFTFHRRSTYVFLKKISKSIVLETLTEIIYPSAGSMALGKTLCPPIKTTVDIYTSIQIFPVYLFLNFCVLLILLLSSITRKPPRLKSPSCIYKRITLYPLEAAILRQFDKRIVPTRVVSLNPGSKSSLQMLYSLADHRKCGRVKRNEFNNFQGMDYFN